MNTCQEFITYNDKLYVIYRKLKNGRVKDEYLDNIKDIWNCDLVLKSKQQDLLHILFLREIKDAEVLN
jgi:hypothetical protein